jgi:redox-sensing transcriptional repressor
MIFDNDAQRVGTRVGEYVVQDGANLAAAIRQAGIKVAMLAVPASSAQEVADELVNAGVEAILNYAPISINVPNGVHVQYIDPAIHLQRMTYYL